MIPVVVTALAAFALLFGVVWVYERRFALLVESSATERAALIHRISDPVSASALHAAEVVENIPHDFPSLTVIDFDDDKAAAEYAAELKAS